MPYKATRLTGRVIQCQRNANKPPLLVWANVAFRRPVIENY